MDEWFDIIQPDYPDTNLKPELELKYTIIELINQYSEQLNLSIDVQDIILVLASVVGVGMVFFLAWLGVRKATRTFTTAVSTGEISI